MIFKGYIILCANYFVFVSGATVSGFTEPAHPIEPVGYILFNFLCTGHGYAANAAQTALLV